MCRGFIRVVIGVLVALALTARGASVTVPNYSFESPATAFVTINIDSWQKSSKPDWYQENGGFTWVQLTGAFKNTATNSSDHIDNCDGNQAIWLFAVPEVGLFQDYDSADWRGVSNQFNATFTPGKTFEILSASNLSLPVSNWTSLGLVTNTTGSNLFSEGSLGVGRFYVVKQLP